MSEEVETVTLKLSGKKYRCETLTGHKTCRHDEFVPMWQTDLIGPEQINYRCAMCFAPVPHKDIEAQLPPRNDWQTPGGTAISGEKGFWSTLHREYGFNVDVAASAENTKCPVYFDGLTPDSDALLCDWYGERFSARVSNLFDYAYPWYLDAENVSVWMNPPYNPKGAIEAWLTKALEQAVHGVRSVCLVPMASSVGWFNNIVVPYAEWHSFRGRVPFDDPLATADAKRTSPKQDNLLVIFNPDSKIVGHAAVRDARTGERLWTRPDLLLAA